MSCSKHTLKAQAAVLDASSGRFEENIDWLASIIHPTPAYQRLFRDTWGCNRPPFVEEEVLRDENNRANVKVPQKTWAFLDSTMHNRFFQRLRTRPFIRREYEQALSDILQAVMTGNENITVGDEEEPEEGGLGEEFEEHTDRASLDTSATSGKHVREEGSDVDGRESKKQHLQDTGTSSDLGEQAMTIDCLVDQKPAEYSNPFLRYKDSKAASKVKGFIITGHPGIGKTIFLYYVLLLRLQASQPTILITHPERVIVFLRRGPFSISMADFEDAMQVIPTTAWCLVDANESLETVPETIINTPFFILQAALPKRKHLQWANKTIGILQYVMKPFSLSELIIGRNRSLDVSKTLSEESLQEYYRRYTPSARFAYQHAGNLDKYTKFVQSLLRQLTDDRLKNLIGAFPLNVDSVGEQILYHILTVTAKAGGQRSIPEIDISSHHLSQLIQLQSSSATVVGCCVLGFNLHAAGYGW
ncbi:hypothetical protein ARMSODRAFT_1083199 [Armillaria solidipes]|uniref:Uncharacterized protein n=1 Tax=Armillaria solidipes TaxID=1076256 RepID=A0A2H3BLR3_9AGAR|nr:hypothetical protein ARMSODRAFT_1083199 [Armillaria solidipes]